MSAYFGLISLITFAVWGADKYRARAGLWRIPERVLFALVLLGGAFGALAGMLIFHHKTRKPLFWMVVGAGCILHVGILTLVGLQIG